MSGEQTPAVVALIAVDMMDDLLWFEGEVFRDFGTG
jgi:hypothetical protein